VLPDAPAALTLRVLDARDIRAACSMREAIDAVGEGFRALSSGGATVPLRTGLTLRSPGSVMLTMPAVLHGGPLASVKIVSVAPNNAAAGVPVVQAAVLLVDADSGRPRALLEGSALTALRTGAAGGLAARQLAPERVETVALYGVGVQARSQLEALLAVRRPKEVRVVARHPERAAAFARDFPAADDLRIVPADRWAVEGADVVICATTSSQPVFDAEHLGPSTHVTAVGSFRADMCEVPPEVLRGARVVVDQRAAALAEAGEIVAALDSGYMKAEDLVEIGEPAARRASPAERTIFKSVGNAIQDLVVAARVFQSAEQRDLGVIVSFA
jgi:ornithine cyclodeaminase/alanine dehydrogenase-like protein (mu-crystallin family)